MVEQKNINLGEEFSKMGKELLSDGILKGNLVLNERLKDFAKMLFYKGYISVESMNMIKKIFIFDVEFYCHQEGKERDTKMYHTNDKISNSPRDKYVYEYKESGFPFVHQSGVDIIIYECEENGVRLTMLIRGILILKEGDMNAEMVKLSEKDQYNEINGLFYRIEIRPTFIIGQLLSGSIFTNGGITIKWVTEDLPVEIKSFKSFKKIPEANLRKNLEELDKASEKKWRFTYLNVQGDHIV